MVSMEWLAYSWEETAGLTDFLAKLHFGGFSENFLSSTNAGTPEVTSVWFDLYPKPQKRSRRLYAPRDIQAPPSGLTSHVRLFSQCPRKLIFLFLLSFHHNFLTGEWLKQIVTNLPQSSSNFPS